MTDDSVKREGFNLSSLFEISIILQMFVLIMEIVTDLPISAAYQLSRKWHLSNSTDRLDILLHQFCVNRDPIFTT